MVSLVGKMSRHSSPERPVFVAHQLCHPHLCQLVEDAIESFNNAWLLPPIEGELFDSKEDTEREMAKAQKDS
jgi:hypothetical protein